MQQSLKGLQLVFCFRNYEGNAYLKEAVTLTGEEWLSEMCKNYYTSKRDLVIGLVTNSIRGGEDHTFACLYPDVCIGDGGDVGNECHDYKKWKPYHYNLVIKMNKYLDALSKELTPIYNSVEQWKK